MANFKDASGNDITRLTVRPAALTVISLWGGGPQGEALDVVGESLFIVRIDEIKVAHGKPNTRYFQLVPLFPGVTTIRALLRGRDYAMPLVLTVALLIPHSLRREYYHGTTLEFAKQLIGLDIGAQAVPTARLLDDSEYTDFGKGFYIHPPENRKLAIDWAKNTSSRAGVEWGVATFVLSDQEMDNIAGGHLLFPSKRNHRPANAPKLVGNQPATWIEFVEFNRHVRPGVKRPKDNDWTGEYGVMRGPIWVQQDSGLPGKLPPFDEKTHQINLGAGGLAMLNSKEAKARRCVIHKGNA
jgi:hypothetical protein